MCCPHVEKKIDKFFERIENRERDYAEENEITFIHWRIFIDFKSINDKENERILIYQVMHPGSEIPLDKHRMEVNLAIKLRIGEVLENS